MNQNRHIALTSVWFCKGFPGVSAVVQQAGPREQADHPATPVLSVLTTLTQKSGDWCSVDTAYASKSSLCDAPSSLMFRNLSSQVTSLSWSHIPKCCIGLCKGNFQDLRGRRLGVGKDEVDVKRHPLSVNTRVTMRSQNKADLRHVRSR